MFARMTQLARPTFPIAIGSDHGGFDLKQHLMKWLADHKYSVEDCGSFDKTPCDYPAIAAEVAARISDGRAGRGIIIDGAGIGSSMVANKLPGVRAALCYDLSSARNSREHNDANVLTLGASLIGAGLAEQIVELFLTTDCTAERHQRRVAMIGEIERDVRGRTDRVESTMERADCGCRYSGRGEPMDELKNMSPEDIDRIAARIFELAGPTGFAPTGPCACCGADCRGHCAEKNPAAVREFLAAGAGRIAHGLGGGPIAADVAKFIDHTLLKPEATIQQIEQLCKEAAQFGFASVCINPSFVALAARLLKGSTVKVCTVAGFPLGTHVPEIKAMEARRAIREGAQEIDMVINIGALKSGDDDWVYRDIKAVTDACIDGRALCKVIIECALLTDEEKVRACQIARRARADFVKTSTGFSTGGATTADVALMAQAVAGTRMGVKAAGGIRSYEDVKKMVAAGATRIGASAGVGIVKEAKGVTESKTAPPAAASVSASKY
jgi:deoxyribose-phosphate aldolase